MPVSEAFLKERAMAVGGSDVLHLMRLAPFGCDRRLWYDKKGVPPDYPFTGNRHTARGEAMEPFARFHYEIETGRKVRAVDWRVLPRRKHVGCHADGIVFDKKYFDEGMGDGLLEIKCPQARYYYAVRSKPDAPNEAWLQAQWGMFVHNLSWGSVLLFSADAWQAAIWDFESDRKVQEDLAHLADVFWGDLSLTEPPGPRLEPNDNRCRSCPWKKTCQGHDDVQDIDRAEAIAGDLYRSGQLHMVDPEETTRLVGAYLAAKTDLKSATEVFDIAKSQLEGMFPAPGRIECDKAEVRLSIVRRKAYTAEVKATTYPILHVTTKVEEPFANDGDIETYY